MSNTIKRVGSRTSTREIEQIGVTPEESKGKKGAVSKELIAKLQLEPEAKQEIDKENTVLVYNISNSHFHVPYNGDPKEERTVIKFEVGEIKAFPKAKVSDEYFQQCFAHGKLKRVTLEQAEEIKKARKKESRKDSVKVGLHSSGLPQNTKAALDYIYACEDSDELEQFATLEDREIIINAIDDRIEDIEGGES